MKTAFPWNERGRLHAAGRSENWLHLNHIAFANDREHRRAKRALRELCIVAMTRDVDASWLLPESEAV